MSTGMEECRRLAHRIRSNAVRSGMLSSVLLALLAVVPPVSQAMEVPPEKIMPPKQAELQWKKAARRHVDTSEAAHELRMAAAVGDLETVRRLVEERGVSPNAANRFGKTPLMMAA